MSANQSLLLLLLLLLDSAALLLAGCAARGPANCDLGEPEGLSTCIKRLLIDSRPKIAEETEPLRLPNHNDGGFKASSIIIRGISNFGVNDLAVTFPSGGEQIAVHASIAWSHLKGDLDAELTGCKKIFWRKRCLTAHASPDVTVGKTVGTLTTTLNVDVDADGNISVTATGTDVSLNLADIDVTANLHGTFGLLNTILGDPASKISTWLADNWWRNNKGKIETKARDALDKAVREHVSIHLSQLLRPPQHDSARRDQQADRPVVEEQQEQDGGQGQECP